MAGLKPFFLSCKVSFVQTGWSLFLHGGAFYLFVFKQDKTWKFVEGLPINDFSREKMNLTAKELIEEKETAVQFLSSAWLGDEEIQSHLRVEESKSRL